MNSIPMPTPGSQVRTTAGVMILSESIQKMMVRGVPKRQWSLRLHIAATTANVGSVGLHACPASVVANLDRKRNPEPLKASFAVDPWGKNATSYRLARNLCRPRTFLTFNETKLHLSFIRQSRVPCRYDCESRLLVLMLYPDCVARGQSIVDARQHCAIKGEVAGIGTL